MQDSNHIISTWETLVKCGTDKVTNVTTIAELVKVPERLAIRGCIW